MLFITTVMFIPAYGIAIWGLVDPEDAMLFLNRWRYHETPEFSELQFKVFKYGNIAMIVVLTILLIVIARDTFSNEPEFPENIVNLVLFFS